MVTGFRPVGSTAPSVIAAQGSVNAVIFSHLNLIAATLLGGIERLVRAFDQPTFPIWKAHPPPADGRITKIQPNRNTAWRDGCFHRSIMATSTALTGPSGAIPAHFATCRAHFACRSPRADDFSRQHGDSSCGRRSSIMSRMRRNRSRDTATSAIWKTA